MTKEQTRCALCERTIDGKHYEVRFLVFTGHVHKECLPVFLEYAKGVKTIKEKE